ncbi:unnamed protein product [Effrenium voratum]|nr:unnamed protein product [Effrenium voratum]
MASPSARSRSPGSPTSRGFQSLRAMAQYQVTSTIAHSHDWRRELERLSTGGDVFAMDRNQQRLNLDSDSLDSLDRQIYRFPLWLVTRVPQPERFASLRFRAVEPPRGRGGSRRSCYDSVRDKMVVIKQLPPEEEHLWIQEVRALHLCLHPNIVTLLEVFHPRTCLFEAMATDLRALLRNRQRSDPYALALPMLAGNLRSVLRQLLRGVAHIHRLNLMHRDLKPEHILWSPGSTGSPGTWKICGLWSSGTQGRANLTLETTTLWYRAPEQMMQAPYDASIDDWALGCILYEMLKGRPLFPGDSEYGQLIRIFQDLGTPNDRTWPGVERFPQFSSAFPQWKGKFMQAGADPDALPLGIVQYGPDWGRKLQWILAAVNLEDTVITSRHGQVLSLFSADPPPQAHLFPLLVKPKVHTLEALQDLTGLTPADHAFARTVLQQTLRCCPAQRVTARQLLEQDPLELTLEVSAVCRVIARTPWSIGHTSLTGKAGCEWRCKEGYLEGWLFSSIMEYL